MNTVRSLISCAVRSRTLMVHRQFKPLRIQKAHSSHDESTRPGENLPFKPTSIYLTTLFFCFFFGSGFWAPFIIVWYSMAKRAL